MKKLFFLIALALVFSSCGGDSKSSEDEMNAANFFDRYLDTLCTASSKCDSGFVNSENLSFCPKTILNSAAPFEGFHKGESVIFKHKYEMLKNAEEIGWLSIDMLQVLHRSQHQLRRPRKEEEPPEHSRQILPHLSKPKRPFYSVSKRCSPALYVPKPWHGKHRSLPA